MKYHPAVKRSEILTLAATWANLEGVTQREMSQTQKDKYHMTPLT